MAVKRFLAILFALVMVLSFAACGKDSNKGNDKIDYSKLSTKDKLTYILGKISDEPDTKGDYINELIGIRINLKNIDESDVEYPTKIMKETDYTKEYLSTIESQESIKVLSIEEYIASMSIIIKKMPQSELDKLNLETYTIDKENETETVRKKVAGIPTYVQYGEYTGINMDYNREYTSTAYHFAIKCDGYLAEFNIYLGEDGANRELLDRILPLGKMGYIENPKETTLSKLYDSYEKIENIGNYKEQKRITVLSENDDRGVEIKRVYGWLSGNYSKEEMVTYNPENNTLSIVTVDAGFYDDYSSEDEIIVEFNEDGKPVRKVDSDSRETIYTYDEEGFITEIHKIVEGISNKLHNYEYYEGRKIIKDTVERREYEYDDNGFIISRTVYYDDFDFSKYYYENDSEGKLLKMFTKNKSGEIDVLQENTYDKEGYLIYKWQ